MKDRYSFNRDNMAILDTENNCFVCLIGTKRPDLLEIKLGELLNLANIGSEKSMNDREKKMFSLNEDGVAEYIVATSKNEALSYAASIWGFETVFDCWEEYKKDCPNDDFNDFIDYFVKEVDEESMFCHMEYGPSFDQKVTKTVKEFLDDINEVPCYFAHQDY